MVLPSQQDGVSLRWLWGVIIALIAADQISKQIMLDLVFMPPQVIMVTGFFNLVPVWNPGISFGLFADQPGLVRWGTSGLAGFIFIWLARQLSDFPPILRLAAAGVMAGGVGNMIDRILYGKVVDFIDLHIAGYHWPAFNLADSAISIGVLLWIYAIVTGRDKKDVRDDGSN